MNVYETGTKVRIMSVGEYTFPGGAPATVMAGPLEQHEVKYAVGYLLLNGGRKPSNTVIRAVATTVIVEGW